MKKLLLSVASWLGCYAMRGDVNGDGAVTDYCRVTFRDNALESEHKQYIGLRLAE